MWISMCSDTKVRETERFGVSASEGLPGGHLWYTLFSTDQSQLNRTFKE